VGRICTAGTCRTASDCVGLPSAACAEWACVAALCVSGCYDGGLPADAPLDSGTIADAGHSIPDSGPVACGPVRTATTSDLLLNEFLADPPPGIPGDANLDNLTDSADDEFVEIGNISGSKLQLSGVTISDGRGVKHVFSDFVLDCNKVIVVFGGGITAMWPVNWLVASSGGLSLNNSGDTISIRTSAMASSDIDAYMYGAEAGRDESLTRSPDLLKDARFVSHSSLATGKAYSPGTRSDGNPF
jgi:hypothetical protein